MAEPTFRLLQNGDEKELQKFLLTRFESSMFLYSNMQQAGLEDHGLLYQGTYAAVFDGQAITGVVAHYWNNTLIVQGENHLAHLIQLAISTSGRPIGGIMGADEQVVVARDVLKLEQIDLLRDETQWLYSLRISDLTVPEILSSGQVSGRRAQTADLRLLANWRAAYLAEVLGFETTEARRQDAYNNMKKYVREGRTWILESDGIPVASSSFNAVVTLGENESFVQVGGVWTPPKHRRKGYGRAAVAATLLDAQTEGAIKAILFTADDNLPAQKAYAALGFHRIGNYRITILRKPLKEESN